MKKIALLFAFLFINFINAQNFVPTVDYKFNGTPTNGIKIKTNIPFADGSAMPNVIIEGYNYGEGKSIGLSIVWYTYGGVFLNHSVSSFGDYVPPIQLSNEGGKVVIFINDKKYFNRFAVKAFENIATPANVTASLQGWTVADEAISGTGTVTVPYKNSFAGDVNMPGSGIWNSSGNVGIGIANPGAKLEVNGDSYLLNGTRRIFGHNDRNNYYLGHYTAVGGGSGLDIHWHGGVKLGAATGDVMHVASNGNVGIGIGAANPGAKLEVNGNISTSTGSGAKLTIYDNNNTRNNRIELYADANGANVGSTYSTGGSKALNFVSAGVTQMRISDEGNIGIGIATPISKLSIKGVGSYNNALSVHSPNANQALDILPGFKLTNGDPSGLREDTTMTIRSSGDIAGNIAFASGNDEKARISNNGNFGIGTTNPQAKLDVNGSLNTVGTITNKGGIVMDYDNVDLTIHKDSDVLDWTTFRTNKGNGMAFIGQPDVPAMVVSRANSNVGVGTTTPKTKLDVVGQVLAGASDSTTGTNAFSIRYGANGGNVVNWGSLRSSGASFMGFGVKASTTVADGFESANSDYSMDRSALVVGGSGNALQLFTAPSQLKANGTAITMNQVLKISNTGNAAFNGKVEAKEIKVTTTPTADFVFEEDYNLPKLEEVEKHIKEKKHLPEIASAKEMEKEGVNVGEFQIKLLQKIEELTLYTIEQNKKLEAQNKQIETQNKQILEQNQRIEKLEKKIKS